jgi:hypothetical protein
VCLPFGLVLRVLELLALHSELGRQALDPLLAALQLLLPLPQVHVLHLPTLINNEIKHTKPS